MPHVTYNLEPICGSVAVIGDLTKPFFQYTNESKQNSKNTKNLLNPLQYASTQSIADQMKNIN